MSQDVCYLGLLDVSEKIRRGALTSEAVTRALIDRIERYESSLNSILMLLAETALEEARRADKEIARGFWRGPLHGVPIGIKDIFWTKGLPTTAGMEVLKDFRAGEDATVVRRLRQAGAVLIAKLHMTEGATHAHHPSFSRPANPWSRAHWTGVSSSGSGVAVAAGFCYGALGTDTGGSIRIPSAANSLTGIKPTWGRVSRHGLIALSESLDHIGPMARSAADAAAMLQAIAGADRNDPTALADPVPDYLAGAGVSDLVIGIDEAYATHDMPEPIVAAVHTALEVFAGMGAKIRTVAFPSQGGETTALLPILLAEAAAGHAETFPAKADRYGPILKALLQGASALDAVNVARAYQAKERFSGRMATFFRDVDMIITPGMGRLLPTWEEIESFGADLAAMTSVLAPVAKFTAPFNIAGTPTLSLPGGFTESGLPIGLQLAGRKLSEANLIRAGIAFQRATDFHTRHPPLE
jgi:amidase